MAQFAHVARPGIALQPCLGLRAQLFGDQPMGLGVVPQKRLRQDQDILLPFAQRMAVHLASRNGPWAGGPLSWMTRATSPFPVPVSPCSNTVGTKALPTVSNAAKWRICARKAPITGAWPTRRSVGEMDDSGPEPAM